VSKQQLARVSRAASYQFDSASSLLLLNARFQHPHTRHHILLRLPHLCAFYAMKALLSLHCEVLPLLLLAVAWLAVCSGYEPPLFSSALSVRFKNRPISSGSRVLQSTTVTPPTVSLPAASASHLYCIVMIDPDAPSASSPVMAEWLHYLQCDVPGHELAAGLTLAASSSSSSSALPAGLLATYAPPTPPPGTGPHRYVLHALRQSGRLGDAAAASGLRITSSSSMKRAKWSLQRWIAECEAAAGVELVLDGGSFFTVGDDGGNERQQGQQPEVDHATDELTLKQDML
jgi:phosphatidylethanolamine-binding protein (PEBP) family uncharacterized protein